MKTIIKFEEFIRLLKEEIDILSSTFAYGGLRHRKVPSKIICESLKQKLNDLAGEELSK